MSNSRTTELRRCKHCGEKPQVLKRDGRVAHACRVLDRELRVTVDEWNAENEDATDVLRCMLDERGVEYGTDDRNGMRETTWCGMAAFQLSSTAKMTMIVTPEQAIAATLGNGTLTAEQVREAAKSNSRQYESPVDDGVWIREYDWQAIAATLNAELGVGECELVYGENDDGVDGWYTQCGGWFAATFKNGRMVHPKFCQLCGGKVVRA